jgi:S-adenosylmethionine:tRNA ribosyltransferase-isomerase
VTIPAETIVLLEQAKKEGRRIIAVGTTSMRSLESYAAGKLKPIQSTKYKIQDEGSENNKKNPSLCTLSSVFCTDYEGNTDLYVTPGYEFQMVDVLITNFHAPRTSLLVLVAAFMGYEMMMQAYHYALENNFRFLSFGDAMWVEKN